jgi:hypothetical protein
VVVLVEAVSNRDHIIRSPQYRINDILAKGPQNRTKAKARGYEAAYHAEDMHLRLAIRNGGRRFEIVSRLYYEFTR